MSLQRIFELVKRQGLPLVMTDGQGRDPVIVLPLDVYEALVEASGGSAAMPGPVSHEQEPVIVPVRDESSSSAPEANAVSDPTPDLLAELSTEERFYIDSLQEDKMG
jgi:hypothetical protein